MNNFGQTQKGKFIIEKVDSLAQWSTYDQGRFVYARDADKYYVGGLTDWVPLPLGDKSITARMLDIGVGLHQINAANIPTRDILKMFTDSSSIEDVLINLAKGLDIQDEVIDSRHIAKNCIGPDLINLGITEAEIGAHNILYNDSKHNVATPVSNMIDEILNTYPIVTNILIDTTHWDYDSTTNMFYAVAFFNDLKATYPIIQFYDEFGNMFLPNRVIVEIKNKKIKLWSPYKMIINISIMG